MSSTDYTRRDLIRNCAAGSGFVVLGSLSGCNGDGDGTDDGNGNGTDDGTNNGTDDGTGNGTETETETDTDPGTPGNISPGSIVPAQAEAVVSIDFEAMLNDDDLKGIANTFLDQMRQFDSEGEVPEDVDAAIEQAKSESDLDPTGLNQGTLFMKVEGSDVEEEYAGIVVQTDWSETELVAFLESESEDDVSENEYGGKTIYESASGEDDGGLAVLSDGQYVIGPQTVLEDTIDVANGDGEAISGGLLETYDATTDGHVEFATVVPEGSFDDEDFDDIDSENFKAIEHMSGSLYKSGSSYGVEMNMRTGDADSASALSGDLETLVNVAVMSEETSGELQAALESIEYSTDGQITTMTFEENVDKINEYVQQYATTILFMMMMGGASGTSM